MPLPLGGQKENPRNKQKLFDSQPPGYYAFDKARMNANVERRLCRLPMIAMARRKQLRFKQDEYRCGAGLIGVKARRYSYIRRRPLRGFF